MVAPIRVISPLSTWCRKASCWALLKRWISSTKSTVRRRWSACWERASAITARISLTPESTAEKCTKWARVSPAMMRARVVLPHPGGPHRIMEKTRSVRTACRMSPPSPTRRAWPTNSSSRRGRMRSASGLPASAVFWA